MLLGRYRKVSYNRNVVGHNQLLAYADNMNLLGDNIKQKTNSVALSPRANYTD
jgi:hypothetical protein